MGLFKSLLGVFGALVLFGCGHTARIDPAFLEYVDDFESHIGVAVTDTDIVFDELDGPTLGYCITGQATNEIHIDRKSWSMMTKDGQEQLIYHELGHCVLGLEHNNLRTILDGYYVEASIMNAYWFGNRSYYSKYKENYKYALKYNISVSSFRPYLSSFKFPKLLTHVTRILDLYLRHLFPSY